MRRAAALAAALLLVLCWRGAVAQPAVALGNLGGDQVPMNGLVNFPKWNRLVGTLLAAPPAGEVEQWARWSASLRTLPASERLFAIHSRGNHRVGYRTDPDNWRLDDYWELPGEIFGKERSTDCEGYAILKYFLAVQAGFSPDDLFIMAGVIRSTREMHAVLVVRAGGSSYVLDNRLPTVQQVDLYGDFVPLYLLDSRQAWRVKQVRR